MREKFELALGTVKQEGETWNDVFARLNKERGVDHKTVIAVLICIMEELDAKKETRKIYISPDEVAGADYGVGTSNYIVSTTVGTEESYIPTGSGQAEEETTGGDAVADGGDTPTTSG